MSESRLAAIPSRFDPNISLLDSLEKVCGLGNAHQVVLSILGSLAEAAEAEALDFAHVLRYVEEYSPWKGHPSPQINSAMDLLDSLAVGKIARSVVAIGLRAFKIQQARHSNIEKSWGRDWFDQLPEQFVGQGVRKATSLSPKLLLEVEKTAMKGYTLAETIEAWTTEVSNRGNYALRRDGRHKGRPFTEFLLAEDIRAHRRAAERDKDQARKTPEILAAHPVEELENVASRLLEKRSHSQLQSNDHPAEQMVTEEDKTDEQARMGQSKAPRLDNHSDRGKTNGSASRHLDQSSRTAKTNNVVANSTSGLRNAGKSNAVAKSNPVVTSSADKNNVAETPDQSGAGPVDYHRSDDNAVVKANSASAKADSDHRGTNTIQGNSTGEHPASDHQSNDNMQLVVRGSNAIANSVGVQCANAGVVVELRQAIARIAELTDSLIVNALPCSMCERCEPLATRLARNLNLYVKPLIEDLEHRVQHNPKWRDTNYDDDYERSDRPPMGRKGLIFFAFDGH
jgi:hypothetical protein